MAFIPHTTADVEEMLARIGVHGIEDLFDEIPASLRIESLNEVPAALNEMQIGRLMSERAQRDGRPSCFIGAGAYEHHIPAAVWALTTRGEFYSAYTPYQAEASQGTLQLIYEYQTMMASLTAMEVSNASLYDGATAVAEACLMAVRINRRSRSLRILMPTTVHPHYRDVASNTTSNQGLRFESIPFNALQGRLSLDSLAAYAGADLTALVIQQPNFFGQLEDVDALTDWAHAHDMIVIAVVNPLSLALLKPPGEWGHSGEQGRRGADIVVGEGQPLGVPLSGGGPYFGFMTTRLEHVRNMPGRLVGRTLDLDGKPGFTLTLQAREQHIRRAKATSNICTNQGLLVTAATIYLSLMGPVGLERTATACHARAAELVRALSAVPGVRRAFDGPAFHEAVLLLDRPVAPVLRSLASQNILAGLDLKPYYPSLGDALLVCATETKTSGDIERYATSLRKTLTAARAA